MIENIQVVGLSKQEALTQLKENQIWFRIAREDANYYILTRDMQLNRLNLVIEDDVVVEAYVG
jgi:hypothetical protein